MLYRIDAGQRCPTELSTVMEIFYICAVGMVANRDSGAIYSFKWLMCHRIFLKYFLKRRLMD